MPRPPCRCSTSWRPPDDVRVGARRRPSPAAVVVRRQVGAPRVSGTFRGDAGRPRDPKGNRVRCGVVGRGVVDVPSPGQPSHRGSHRGWRVANASRCAPQRHRERRRPRSRRGPPFPRGQPSHRGSHRGWRVGIASRCAPQRHRERRLPPARRETTPEDSDGVIVGPMQPRPLPRIVAGAVALSLAPTPAWAQPPAPAETASAAEPSRRPGPSRPPAHQPGPTRWCSEMGACCAAT